MAELLILLLPVLIYFSYKIKNSNIIYPNLFLIIILPFLPFSFTNLMSELTVFTNIKYPLVIFLLYILFNYNENRCYKSFKLNIISYYFIVSYFFELNFYWLVVLFWLFLSLIFIEIKQYKTIAKNNLAIIISLICYLYETNTYIILSLLVLVFVNSLFVLFKKYEENNPFVLLYLIINKIMIVNVLGVAGNYQLVLSMTILCMLYLFIGQIKSIKLYLLLFNSFLISYFHKNLEITIVVGYSLYLLLLLFDNRKFTIPKMIQWGTFIPFSFLPIGIILYLVSSELGKTPVIIFMLIYSIAIGLRFYDLIRSKLQVDKVEIIEIVQVVLVNCGLSCYLYYSYKKIQIEGIINSVDIIFCILGLLIGYLIRHGKIDESINMSKLKFLYFRLRGIQASFAFRKINNKDICESNTKNNLINIVENINIKPERIAGLIFSYFIFSLFITLILNNKL